MTAQLSFYAVCLIIWMAFRMSTPPQRRKILNYALWGVLAFGTVGFIAEMAMRGGDLPFSW
jgi:hypothetical protein